MDSSQGRRALWSGGMEVEEERGNRKIARKICQNGFGGSKEYTGLYLIIRRGKRSVEVETRTVKYIVEILKMKDRWPKVWLREGIRGIINKKPS